MRSCQGLAAETTSFSVAAMAPTRASASSSICGRGCVRGGKKGGGDNPPSLEKREELEDPPPGRGSHALISSSTHISSFPGSASHSSSSLSRGRRCFGSLVVCSVERYAQSQAAIFWSTPKHLFKLASYDFPHQKGLF